MRLVWPLEARLFCILIAVGLGSSIAAQTPEAGPGFALQSDVGVLNLTAGGALQEVSLTASAHGGFSGVIEVRVAGLPANITVTPDSFNLRPGKTEKLSFAAEANAVAAASTIEFSGASGSLHGTASVPLNVSVDAVTYHYNIERTGLNASEGFLTPGDVNAQKFGLQRILPMDGLVDGQPLYLSNVPIGRRMDNIVYAVSENDSVYAFGVNTGALIWKHSVLGANETPSDDHGCGQITPTIGITSTPVIDRKAGPHGAIFVVGMTLDSNGNYHQRLHALDITTGEELPHSPAEIHATYPGTGANSSNGTVVFDPAQYAERAGLLLLNGVIYLGWTSHCDDDPYTGWLMGYSESTLQQTSVLNLTPNGSEGSIWMAGSGIAAGPGGYIFVLDANGTFDATLNSKGFPVNGDYGNGFLEISTIGNKLAVADYFEDLNTVNESNNDEDLGSGGVLVLPDLKDASGRAHALAVGAGKNSNIYVVDRNNMGKFNPNNDNAIYQEIDGQIDGGVWSMPAYFNNTIYYAAVGDTLKAFPITNAKLAAAPTQQSANSFPFPGATPSVSANGTRNGIVWAVENSSRAVLHAYKAGSLEEVYNSSQAPNNRDNFGGGNKFITPMVVDGKVLVGTPNGVAVFGLLR